MATGSLNSSRKKKERPFYEVPDVQTSAKIIAEARNSIRALPTERPFTPAGDHRILFGQSSIQSRPPSAYSTIGAHHFSDDRLSRPPTGYRLAPIEATLSRGAPSTKFPRGPQPTPPPSSWSPRAPVKSSGLASTGAPSTLHAQNYQPVPSICLPVDDSQWGKTYSETSLTPFPSATSLSTTVLDASRSLHGVSDNQQENLQEPGELEPKRSMFSPVHSKRSLSAGVIKQVLSEELRTEGVASRIVSAGDLKSLRKKKEVSKVSQKHGNDERREKIKKMKVDKSKDGSVSQPSHETSRKSSVTSLADLPIWEDEILPILEELESTSYEGVDRLRSLCDSLWSQLDAHELLGKTGGVGGTKRRSKVLRTVFKLLDHKDPLVLLKVAKIIIGMQVTGKNLLNVCKLLFALGREESNDHHFTTVPVTGCLVEALLQVDLEGEQETLIYGLGTLKLLASCPEVREQLTRSTQVMPLLINVLGMCTQPGKNTNVLIQLTGALRCLSDSLVVRETFTSTGIIPHLARVLSNHMDSEDIVFNISRLFSKLTLTAGCLTATLQCPSLLPLFLRALTVHTSHIDIVVRVCFILGNMTADDEEVRSLLYFKNSVPDCLTPLLRHFLQLQLEQVRGSVNSEGDPQAKGESGKNEATLKLSDVLVKLVRLVANLSVSPEVGPSIATDQDTISSLFTILEFIHVLLMKAHSVRIHPGRYFLSTHFISLLKSFPLSAYEELVVNCLGTLNNLTYYADANSIIIQRLEEVTRLLVNVMMVDSNAGLLEATRVCGNLTRYPAVRTILLQNKVDELAVTLLDSGRRELVYSSCGVLVNLLADSACRDNMAINGGLRKLVEVLHDLGLGDWQLASLVCKTLWNYSEKLSSSADCFGEQEALQLTHILTTYLDEAQVFPASDPHEDTDVSRQIWQTQFLPVAQALLERIKAYTSLTVA